VGAPLSGRGKIDVSDLTSELADVVTLEGNCEVGMSSDSDSEIVLRWIVGGGVEVRTTLFERGLLTLNVGILPSALEPCEADEKAEEEAEEGTRGP